MASKISDTPRPLPTATTRAPATKAPSETPNKVSTPDLKWNKDCFEPGKAQPLPLPKPPVSLPPSLPKPPTQPQVPTNPLPLPLPKPPTDPQVPTNPLPLPLPKPPTDPQVPTNPLPLPLPTDPQVPTEPLPEPGPVEPTPEPKPEPSITDSDPMTHIAYLASDELQGRDSPSAGLDAASAYVQAHVEKYGLVGPNSNNPENPFQQKFDVFSFASKPEAAAAGDARANGHAEHKQFGHQLFQEGFYLEEGMPRETLEMLNKKYESTMKAEGQPLTPARGGGLRSVEELRALATESGQAVNTMAMLPGTGPHKDEVIVVMAHLDHVGTDRRGNIHNGADDNASGSAVLMAAVPELAEAQKRGELDRSILFIWTGAEEKGLVGSQYFVDHPIPGLSTEQISGVVNVDMVGRWDDQRLSVVDTDRRGQANYFRDVVDQANAQLADPFDRINRDINVYRDRQDGAVFGRKGEDVLFLFEGLSNPKGGGDLIPEYHEPGDDIDLILRDNGGEKPRRVKDLMVNVIELAANRTTAKE
ncbi:MULTISPECIES: M28 family metallopeptidase [Myxococcus]|uniref:M28 family metallopeptidase n=1 Tax=Myxococcus TaxID=32 RepID=UPI0013D6755D|nr:MULTISPECIES: M28 family peptidase [Myxococcus]NVJ23111.1 M28 family peptidase [Myxococcus sp. AM011]